MSKYDTEKAVKLAIQVLQNIRTNKRKYFQQPNMLKAELLDIGRFLIEVSELEHPEGCWWCTTHDRPAAWVDKRGKRRCDPSKGGILLPCIVEFKNKGLK